MTIEIVKYFGPEDFGIYSFALSLMTISLPLASLGLESLISKEINQKKINTETIIGTSLYLRIIAGIIINICMYLIYLSFFTSTQKEHLVVITTLITGLIYSTQIFEYFFKAIQKSKLASISAMSSFCFGTGFRIYILVQKLPIEYLAISLLCEVSLYGIVLWLNYNRTFKFALKFDINYAKSLIKESIPLFLGATMVAIYMQIDQIMIRKMLNNEQVGLYGMTVKLSEFSFMIPTAVLASISPKLTQAFKKDEKIFHQYLQFFLGLNFYLFLFIAIVFALFSKPIILFLFGNQYIQASASLAMHPFSGVFASMALIYSYKYILKKNSYIPLYGSIFGAIANIILNLLLIPSKGINGAAISTIISYCLPFIFIGIFLDRKIFMDYFSSLSMPIKTILGRKPLPKID